MILVSIGNNKAWQHLALAELGIEMNYRYHYYYYYYYYHGLVCLFAVCFNCCLVLLSRGGDTVDLEKSARAIQVSDRMKGAMYFT